MIDRLRIALAALALLLAAAGEPPQTAFLRIEAGAHVGAVTRVAVDAAGGLLATAGFDKTIRLWTMPEGAPRGVLRPPIGARQEGEIYALAISPDGSRVFAAGATGGQWDGSFAVYVFDVARMALAGLLPGMPAPINALAISPDGSRLAIGLAAGGVRVVDAVNGHALFEDRAYAGPVRNVALDRLGRLFVAAADGVRAYDPGGRRTAATGSRTWGLALSPDTGLLAVTSDIPDKAGRLHLDVLSARTLAVAFSPDTSGLAGEGLLAVSWSSDAHGGVQLVAGGYARGDGGNILRRWGDYGLGTPRDVAVSRDTVRDIVTLPSGGVAFAAEDPGWGRLAPDGRLALRPAPPLIDLRASRQHLAVSPDGAVVELATGSGLLRFAATTRSLAPVAAADTALRIARPPERLVGWRDGAAPRLGSVPLGLDRGEFSRAAAALPDGHLLLGTDTHLRLFAADGHPLATTDIPEAAWELAVGDGVAVAALLDGTLRWFDLAGSTPLTERAALFAHADSRWVLFTPEGLFDDSDHGGNDLVGLHLNRGRNQQPAFLSFSQAYRMLHAPDLVRARLLGDPAPALARLAALGDVRRIVSGEPAVTIADACATRVDGSCQPIDIAADGTSTLPAATSRLQITLRLVDRGAGIGPIDPFVNGRNTGRMAPPSPGLPAILQVPLDAGANRITVRAYDAAGKVFAESATLMLRTTQPGATPRPRLFVLSIGIDHFANPSLTLNSAVSDSQTVSARIRAAASPLFSDVDITQMTEGQATRTAILAAFDRLAREVQPEDTFLFYVASHGVRDEDDDRFLLVPADLQDVSSWAAMARQSIDEQTLVAALARIPARDSLLMIDTCHAGKVPADSLANVGHETGRYILAASGSVQEALDSYDGRNGVFVYALREALDGKAGRDSEGNLGALALGEYVSRRVGELARSRGHAQDAVFRAAQRDLHSFPVAHVGSAAP